jgi:hypothetical protein
MTIGEIMESYPTKEYALEDNREYPEEVLKLIPDHPATCGKFYAPSLSLAAVNRRLTAYVLIGMVLIGGSEYHKANGGNPYLHWLFGPGATSLVLKSVHYDMHAKYIMLGWFVSWALMFTSISQPDSRKPNPFPYYVAITILSTLDEYRRLWSTSVHGGISNQEL